MRIGLPFRFFFGFFENEFVPLSLIFLPDEFHHRRPFARIVRSRLAIQSRLDQADPIVQSLGCLCVHSLAGFPPGTRFETSVSILSRELPLLPPNAPSSPWIRSGPPFGYRSYLSFALPAEPKDKFPIETK